VTCCDWLRISVNSQSGHRYRRGFESLALVRL